MSKWQIRLSNLEGLSDDDKLYVEGKLLALGDDGRAARCFKHNEPDKDTARRLRALLPGAGSESEDWSNHWGTSATIKQVTGVGVPYEQRGIVATAIGGAAYLMRSFIRADHLKKAASAALPADKQWHAALAWAAPYEVESAALYATRFRMRVAVIGLGAPLLCLAYLRAKPTTKHR